MRTVFRGLIIAAAASCSFAEVDALHDAAARELGAVIVPGPCAPNGVAKTPGIYCVSSATEVSWNAARLAAGATISKCTDSYYICGGNGRMVKGPVLETPGNTKCLPASSSTNTGTWSEEDQEDATWPTDHFISSQSSLCAIPSPSATPSATRTGTSSSSVTSTASASQTASQTSSVSATGSQTGTPSSSATASSSETSTPSNTGTPSSSETATGTQTPSSSATASSSETSTPSNTGTPSSSETATGTQSPSSSSTASSSETSTPSNTGTPSSSETATGTQTPSSSSTASSSETSTPSNTGTPSSSETATGTETPSSSATASSSETSTPSNTGTPSSSETATGTQSPSSSSTASSSETATPSESPSNSGSPSSSETPSSSATASETPSSSSSSEPTSSTSAAPSSSASNTPARTPSPTASKSAAGCTNGNALNAGGVSLNVGTCQLQTAGWTKCYDSWYGQGGVDVINNIKAACSGSNMLMACYSEANPGVMRLAAWAPTADVTYPVAGTSTARHDANGVSWYFTDTYSWGFFHLGDTVSRGSCDTATGSFPGERMCNHASSGKLNFGYRCGTTFLNNGIGTDGARWHRVWYTKN